MVAESIQVHPSRINDLAKDFSQLKSIENEIKIKCYFIQY